MGKTLNGEQVSLLQALVVAKNKSIKWVLENPDKLKKPMTTEANAELVGKFSSYNGIIEILGGEMIELVPPQDATPVASSVNLGI